MNADEIRASFYGTWHATYLEADGLTPEESRGLPQVWRDLLAAGECAAESVAALWREACPRLPRVADYLEDNVIQVGLSRMTTPHHAVRDLRCENHADDDTTEIALVYITRDLDHVAPFNAWIGRQPFRQELPPWWGSVRSVLGDLATTLHDGLMLDSWDQGLLAVRDMPTMSELWIDYVDPDAEMIYVHREGDYQAAVPRDQWPDFSQLRVIAEGTSNRAWAVDQRQADNTGWGDGADTLEPISDLALAIEDMLCELMTAKT